MFNSRVLLQQPCISPYFYHCFITRQHIHASTDGVSSTVLEYMPNARTPHPRVQPAFRPSYTLQLQHTHTPFSSTKSHTVGVHIYGTRVFRALFFCTAHSAYSLLCRLPMALSSPLVDTPARFKTTCLTRVTALHVCSSLYVSLDREYMQTDAKTD